MAIGTLTELRAATRDFAKRQSIGDSLIDTFVVMTETAIQNGERADDGSYLLQPLRVRAMEAVATIAVTDGAGDLPEDFLEPIAVRLSSAVTNSVQYVTSEWDADAYPTGQASVSPSFYKLVGNTIYCPVDLELTYYQRIPSLVADGANWLLQAAPSAYLYGCLQQYSIWDKNAEQVAGYRSLVANVLGGLGLADVNSRAGSMTRRASMPAF